MLKIFNLFLILLAFTGCQRFINIKTIDENGLPIEGVLIHQIYSCSYFGNDKSFFSETDSLGISCTAQIDSIDYIVLSRNGYKPIGKSVNSDYNGEIFVMKPIAAKRDSTMLIDLLTYGHWYGVHSKPQVSHLKKWFDYNPDALKFRAVSIEKEIEIEPPPRYDSIPIMTGDINHPTWLNAMIYKITKSGDLEVCMSSGVSKEKDFQVIFIGKTGYYPYICIKNIPSHIYLKKIGETKACQIISREFIDSFLPENIDTNQAYNFAWWEYYKKGIISENDSRYYRISGMN